MKKPVLRIIAFCLLLLPAVATARSFSLPEQESPVKILAGSSGDLLIGTHHVYALKKNGAILVLSSESAIRDAVIHQQRLVLATDAGLKVYNSNTFTEQQHTFPAGKITALATDPADRLWIATPVNGCYRQQTTDSFTLVLNIPGVYTLRATPDSNIWIGTNVGMYRLNSTTLAVTRYAEEGYSGYELPDNLVEQIFTDESSNLWVIMPEHVSFKRSDNYTGEIPSFNFVGARNNSIQSIVSLYKGSYIFVTEQGCLLLPSSSLREEHQHNHEVFSEDNTHAYALTNKQLRCPRELENEKVLYATLKEQQLYFVTAKGGWTTSIRKIWQ